MTFVIPAREIVLQFEGEYEGAEIVCRGSVGIGTFLQFSDIEENVAEAFKRFAEDILVSWNLEDHNGSIPATPDGMMRVPPALATAMLTEWSEAVSNPQNGSEPESLNGATSAEQPTLQAI